MWNGPQVQAPESTVHRGSTATRSLAVFGRQLGLKARIIWGFPMGRRTGWFGKEIPKLKWMITWGNPIYGPIYIYTHIYIYNIYIYTHYNYTYIYIYNYIYIYIQVCIYIYTYTFSMILSLFLSELTLYRVNPNSRRDWEHSRGSKASFEGVGPCETHRFAQLWAREMGQAMERGQLGCKEQLRCCCHFLGYSEGLAFRVNMKLDTVEHARKQMKQLEHVGDCR